MMKNLLLAGPCVIEDERVMNQIADYLVPINREGSFDLFFKASFDKANRTSSHSFRGPGLEKGLQELLRIKEKYGYKIVTDIHESWQASPVAEVADMIQIPAFLCRQTDLIQSAARTGKLVNIKKGQFMSGADMRYAVEKARDAGAEKVFLTERGTFFGYNDLVVDFRNITIMNEFADAVLMDCTHCMQKPSANGGVSGGDTRHTPSIALAAKAFGATGYFFEVHPDPQSAQSDSATILQLDKLNSILNLIR